MKKYYLALASSLLISNAFAQTPVSVPASAAGMSKTEMKSDAKRDMTNEKHIKELHARLKITADEEALWTNVAGTMRDSTRLIGQSFRMVSFSVIDWASSNRNGTVRLL